MAGTARQAPDPVAALDALRQRPQDFELFEALRRLECAYPQHPRLGRSARPVQDPVRLGHTPSLAFAPHGIDRLEPGDDGRPPRLKVLQTGLFGPDGPLPLHMSEYALERRRQGNDDTLEAFADVFHHRLLSLFYRAWADAQPTVEQDRPGEDRFAFFLEALFGLWTPQLRRRDALPDDHKRFYAGRLVAQARGGEGLCAFLQGFFAVRIELVEFAGAWMPLPADDRPRMGRHSMHLGQSALMGAHARNAQHRFRLRIGPLGFDEYRRFLPGGEAMRQLRAAVRTYVGEEMAWDVQPLLRHDAVPAMALGREGRMGLTAWMGSFAGRGDADDLVYEPMAHPPRPAPFAEHAAAGSGGPDTTTQRKDKHT